MIKFSRLAALSVCAALAAPVAAQDFLAGLDAYNFGDFATALENWQPLAEQGNALAQYNLGFMYRNGQGVLQDDAEAVRWYRLAAEQGNAIAQDNLGVMYDTGDGVLQDDVLAHMWFNIASANGLESAAENRSRAENTMTREQIADAQARARVCMSSGYQDCE